MLRRFVCVLSALGLIMSLCACDSVTVPFKSEPFTAAVMFQSAGTEIKGELIYNSPSDISFTVSEPENIKGLQFRSDDSVLSVGVENISLTEQNEKDSPVYHLFSAVSELGSSEVQLPLRGEYTAQLTSGNVTIDCASKKIILIDIENYHYKFE